jgi:phosphatidylinositol alpha-mannosyltransferase
MKIAIVTEYYYPTLGGVQEHVHHFAREAAARGHDVRIITSKVRGASLVDEPVPVLRVGRSQPFVANGSIGRMTVGRGLGDELQAIFDRERFDVIHVHAPLTPTLPLLAIARSNAITIGTFHTNFRSLPMAALLRRLGRRFMTRLDGAIGVSPTAVAAIARYFPATYAVIPNGVDTRRFAPTHRGGRERRTILWVGRLEPRNGLDRMIAAFTKAASRRADLDLSIVGDGPLRALYEASIPPHLRGRVVFHGALNGERPARYAAADLLCVPASISSFGITALEGMSAGLPVIASDIDGFRDLVTHARDGLLVDTACPESFADAILRVAGDPRLAETLAREGRATAERYAWPRVADRVLSYYDEVLAREVSR